MFERLRPSEDPQVRFEAVKDTIQRGILTPPLLIPDETVALLQAVLGNTHMVSDDEFDRIHQELSLDAATREIRGSEAAVSSEGAAAFYVPSYIRGTPEIYVRKSWVEADKSDSPNDKVASWWTIKAVVEEMSHAYSTSDATTFPNVPDHSAVVSPLTSKRTLVEKFLRPYRTNAFGFTDRLQTKNVVVKRSGWGYQYSEKYQTEEGEKEFDYPTLPTHIALEEVRALFVRTLFLAKTIGRMRHPRTEDYQMTDGYLMLTMNLRDEENELAYRFINKYTEHSRYREERTRELIRRLYEDTPDRFLVHLQSRGDERIVSAFMEVYHPWLRMVMQSEMGSQ